MKNSVEQTERLVQIKKSNGVYKKSSIWDILKNSVYRVVYLIF